MTEKDIRILVQSVKDALQADPALTLTSPAALPLVEAFLVNQARIADNLKALLTEVRNRQ